MIPEIELRSDTVRLVPLIEADVSTAYVDWLNDPEVTARTEIPCGGWTLETTRQYVAEAAAAGNAMMWAIHYEDAGHVGNIRLSAINREHSRASIAIIIGEKNYWGRGISRHAIELVRDFAFEHLKLHKVCAGIYETNIASRRTFEKAGFMLEAQLKDHAVENGEFIDVWQMAVIRPDAKALAFQPYGRQFIDAGDIQSVVDVLTSDYLTTGPLVGEFEAELAAHLQVPEAVACSNGTTALHLAMLAAGIGSGDQVIVPSVTFLASANAVRYVGGEVVFADVDPDTGLVRPEDVEDALERAGSDSVKAVVSVHLGGQVADPIGIHELAARHQLLVIEDACHALGGTYSDASGRDFAVGSCAHADFATFSFHPVKTVATGEGGAISCRDPEAAETMRRARNHGMIRTAEDWSNSQLALDPDGEPNAWYYEMSEMGFNFRLTDIQCALGISQLKKLDRFVQSRENLRRTYEKLIEARGLPAKPVPRVASGKPGWHLFAVLIDFEEIGKDRNSVMSSLREVGIGTQVHYIPVHLQPYYQNRYGPADLPGAERYYHRTLSLPLHPGMTTDDVATVLDKLATVLN